MRCRTCDYSLWNLSARACPECGQSFKPSDFEFVPNAVRFCCPSCMQTYYGTSEQGHLVPFSFPCVRCSASLCMDDMILLPAEGVADEHTRTGIAWLEPHHGFLKRWWSTFAMAAFSPRLFARALPQDAGVGRALSFALLTNAAFFLVAFGFIFLIISLRSLTRGFGGDGAQGLLALIIVPLCMVALLSLWALVAHGILRATGEVHRTMRHTLMCFCYASAANVLTAVPCLGVYMIPFSMVWWTIVAALMLAVVHRVSGGRAAIAALAAPLLVTLAAIAFGVMVVVPGIQGAISQVNSVAATSADAAVNSAASALRDYAAIHGEAPSHAISLLGDDLLTSSDLYLNGGPDSSVEDTIGSLSLWQISNMPPAARATALRDALPAIEGEFVAHRLGDLVFTCRGIDLSPTSSADRGLWIVVCAPPEFAVRSPSNGVPAMRSVAVAMADGQTQAIPAMQWPAALAQQNALRAAAGLPPLPDPFTITQAAPPPWPAVPEP
jgi:hypothetical protein